MAFTSLKGLLMKRLYRVEVTRVVYVVADDREEAAGRGLFWANKNDHNEPPVKIEEATRQGIKGDNWKGALVYGEHSNDWLAEDAVTLND